MKQLVRDTVHSEMLRDGKSHHYTQRVQKLILDKHEEVLAKKIEKTLENKVAMLQNELEKLKASKLKEHEEEQRNSYVKEGDLKALLGENATEDDIKQVSQEIKKVVAYALRSHFGQGDEFQDGYGYDEEGGHHSNRPSIGKVHGIISTHGSFSKSTDETAIHMPATTNANNALVEEIIIKPKSKADRLLGISTDAKSGMPINDTPAGGNKQSGLFGSIGGLFSSKPGSAMDPSLSSSKPVSSMFSGRGGSQTSPIQSSNSFLGRMHALEPIADDNEEDKKSQYAKSNRSNSSNSVEDSMISGKTDTGSSQMQAAVQAELTAEEIIYRDLMANLLALADLKVGNV
ncbi:hypothetical protein EON65_33910 [archaeon]|nr:MAG: hypothetical protein EON65_33910 [archaeon]